MSTIPPYFFFYHTAHAEQVQVILATKASSVQVVTGIDENTRLLLADHHLLIDRESLEMGEIIGGGNYCYCLPFRLL